MSSWDQDSYIKAWNYASSIHLGQTIPGSDISYINHLGLVAMEAMSAINGSDIETPNLMILCALLHDSIEDTATSYEDIKKEFGAQVAAGVMALTKNEELPTKQLQMSDSLLRIKQQPQEVWMVKLCDRITNLQPPPRHWQKEKIENYRKEAMTILEQLGESNALLAERLKTKIDQYRQYTQ